MSRYDVGNVVDCERTMKKIAVISQTSPARGGGSRGRIRWGLVALILVIAASVLIWAYKFSALDGNFKSMSTVLTVLGTFLALLIWLLFLSGMRWRSRWIGLGCVILGIAALTQLVRFEPSVDSNGLLNFAWKWHPRKDGNVGSLKPLDVPEKLATPESAADSPGYLGQDRRGVFEEVKLERDWTAHPPQELWRQPVGLGWSAFAVVGPRAITQEQRGDKEWVVCYELTTGHVLWTHANEVHFSEPMGGDGPRATPTVGHDRVFALGATGVLDCLELTTGKLLWSRGTLTENKLENLTWAKSGSPLLVDGFVIVSGGEAAKGGTNISLLAYRWTDGSPAWQSGTEKASYASPMEATLAGKRQILSINAASVSSHDPGDGHILWRSPWTTDSWPKCAQPVLIGADQVFVSAGYGTGCMLLKVAANPDGGLHADPVWQNIKLRSQFSNCVARDGFIYGIDDGIMACVEVATGVRKWKDGRYGAGQILGVGDLLLVQTEVGQVLLVEPTPTGLQEIAKIQALHAKTWNMPTLAGSYLLVRNDQEAVCYRLPTIAAKPPATAAQNP